MDIKMIVTDLDSTLLHKNKIISNYTASVFRRCNEIGIKIVFATAGYSAGQYIATYDSGVKALCGNTQKAATFC